MKALTLDYERREARFTLDIWVGSLHAAAEEEPEAYHQAEITLSGLLFWVCEPPDARYLYQDGAPRIDIGSMQSLDKASQTKLPPVPAGAFVNWMFADDWNAFIYVAAKGARLEWLP